SGESGAFASAARTAAAWAATAARRIPARAVGARMAFLSGGASVDPDDVVAQDLHVRFHGQERTLLEARVVDHHQRRDLLVELRHLGLQPLHAVLGLVLHAVA